MKLAERCGHISSQGISVEIVAPLLLILPVAASLIAAYRHESRMDLLEAVGRAILFTLVGATAAALLYSCTV